VSATNLDGMSDTECILRGRERFAGVARKLGPRALEALANELANRLARRGWMPTLDVVWHCAGNVTDEEWERAVGRIPLDSREN
jgi:hypothetical protein